MASRPRKATGTRKASSSPRATGEKKGSEKGLTKAGEVGNVGGAAEQAADTGESNVSTIEETTPQRGGSRAGKMPKYEVGEAVAELPAEPPRVKARVYFNLLEQVKADEDKAGLWVPIATFTTPTGARDVQRSFTKGERDCPKGEWEFKAVKLVDPENASKRISKLFVRYMGEG